MRVCAVIPAAGKGTRLGGTVPKLLTPVSENLTVWSLLRDALLRADHLHVVTAPGSLLMFETALKPDLLSGRVTLGVQQMPLGMGDAIFSASKWWCQAEILLVVWGDQALVSADTVSRAVAMHQGRARTVVVPLVHVGDPYVQYCFEDNGHLAAIRESREGDLLSATGLSDVGIFVLSVPTLRESWAKWQALTPPGIRTGEINFLPFLPWLATRGWDVVPMRVSNAHEARGINTPDDLAFVRRYLEEMKA